MNNYWGISGTLSKFLVLFCFMTAFMVVLLTGNESGYAQQVLEKQNIKGYVKDRESGEALPHANVLVKGTYTGAATNVDGYFVILNVPAILCTLQVSYLGYTTRNVPVDNRIEHHERLVITLKSTPIMSEEVIVTAEINMIEISKNAGQVMLSPRQLLTLPSLGEVDIFRSLQLLPGISGVSDGSSGLYIRGGTPDQNLVLLDGMKIYHVDHFFGFFSAFNADAIKDVRVYKGGFPAEYGGRISSVVDLTGKTGDMNNTRLSVGANLLSAQTLFEYQPVEKSSLVISMRRSFTDYLKSGLYNSIYNFMTGDENRNAQAGGFNARGGGGGRGGRGGQFQQIETTPDFYFYDLNGKFTWEQTNKDIMSLSLYAGKDHLDQSQDFGGQQFSFRNAESDASMNISDITKWGNYAASGKWSHNWSDRIYSYLLISRSIYFSDYDRIRDMENVNINTQRFSSFGSEENNRVNDTTVKFDTEIQLTNSHNFKIGAEFSDFSTTYNVTMNDTTELISRSDESLMTSGYIQDRWKVVNPLELTFGLRATKYDNTGENYFEPRFSFLFRLNDRINFKGAWGEYNQFVSRVTNENILEGSRDFWILADEELKPGYAEHRIAGVSYENRSYLFDIEGYYKDIKNLVEYTRRYALPDRRRGSPGLQTLQTPNFFTGTGTAKGVEFLLQKKRGKLTGWASYTRGEVLYNFPGLNNDKSFFADHDRTHEVKIVSIFKKGAWNISTTWIFASGKAYTSPESQYYLTLLDGGSQSYIHVSDKNSQRLPDYHRMDISISRRFEHDYFHLDFGASVFNAYNHKNVYFREYTLDTTPVLITDKLMLGVTPTVYVKFSIR